MPWRLETHHKRGICIKISVAFECMCPRKWTPGRALGAERTAPHAKHSQALTMMVDHSPHSEFLSVLKPCHSHKFSLHSVDNINILKGRGTSLLQLCRDACINPANQLAQLWSTHLLFSCSLSPPSRSSFSFFSSYLKKHPQIPLSKSSSLQPPSSGHPMTSFHPMCESTKKTEPSSRGQPPSSHGGTCQGDGDSLLWTLAICMNKPLTLLLQEICDLS